MRNHVARYSGLLILSLFLLTFSFTLIARAGSSLRPVSQDNTPWCFSWLEDKEREVGFYLSHPRAITGEKLLENYGMPTEWLESLGDPVCPYSWDKAAEFLDAAQVITFFQDRIIYSIPENLRARYGTPWVGIIDMPLYPPTGSTLEMEDVWCYSFFEQDGAEEGVFLGHFPGLESEKVLARHADVLDMTQSWTERGSECFATWNQARSFAYYLTEDQVPHFGLDEFLEARSVLEIDRMAWPAHSLLAPYGQSALLEPDARPVWCHTIFTGGGGSTMTFNHYPDQTVEDVMAFYKPPAWIKDLAAQQETNCYTSWEAAFRARPLEWKKYLLTLLPANPTEVDFEAVQLESAFQDRWQEFRRPEFSAEGTPDPLMLTRIAPTPTVTPTPTLTPTTDPRTVSQDTAVWCFTYVEDLSHRLIFIMGHSPEMSLNEIRQQYNLPPGLLSQPDRETFCYRTWPDAANFAKRVLPGAATTELVYTMAENYDSADIQQLESGLRQGLGTLNVVVLGALQLMRETTYTQQDQPVWCYSYFTNSTSDSGIYLGHYVGEGDEAILADYGENTAWQRREDAVHCFNLWEEAAEFHQTLTGETVDYAGGKWRADEYDYAQLLIETRKPIPFSGSPLQFITPTTTPTLAPTPTLTSQPLSAALLDPDVTQAVWCYTIFTGGGNSTANFGHYPGMTAEEVISFYSAPDWIKDLAAQQETNCYASWAAAFEGIAPPALQLTLAPYLPEDPSEADYETVILWSYFKNELQRYRKPEFSAAGMPQPVTLTRIAPTASITPTPVRASDGQVWCFSLYYDDTVRVFDVLIGHYPGMDDTAIAALHKLDMDFLSERPGRRTACFYNYTDAAKFQNAVFEGHYLLPVTYNQNEANNESLIENRYIRQAYDIVDPDDLEHVKQIFDEGPFTRPPLEGTPLPTLAPLLDTEQYSVWCATYFRVGEQRVVLGHYPGIDIAEVLELYEVANAKPPYTEEKRVCYTSWQEAANTEYFRADYIDAPDYNEGDYEIMVLQNFLTNLWQVYQQPEFSARVTPQVFQTPLPAATAIPDLPSAAALLDGDTLPRWCHTVYVNQRGEEAFYGHYPDIDPTALLMANGVQEIRSTDCYATWQAAAESLPEAVFVMLSLPANPTEADYELAQLKLFFGDLAWRREQREEFSADVLLGGFTPEILERVVWCKYTIASNSGATSTEDYYPDVTAEEVMAASLNYKDWVNKEPSIKAVICYHSWQEAMGEMYSTQLSAHRDNLPKTLSEGDYQVLFLWFKFSKEWQQQYRSEFSENEQLNPAVIEYMEGSN